MSNRVDDPGEQSGGDRPLLGRAPGERYAAGDVAGAGRMGDSGGAPDPAAKPSGRARRALLAGAAAASIGAAVFCALALLDLGAGLIAPAAAIGWSTALAILWGGNGRQPRGRRSRVAAAAGFGAAAIAAGFLLNWAWSRGEGGVLDPVAYLDQRWGPLALLVIAVAAVAGALRTR